ncbi:hypothetical protein ACX5I6_14625 [Arthrobacter sp. MMS24-T111]
MRISGLRASGFHTGAALFCRAPVLEIFLARPFRQEARPCRTQRGLEPVPRMPRLLTCCSSIPA